MENAVIGYKQGLGEKDYKPVKMISLKDIESALDIEQLAYDDGHKNHPSAEETSLSSTEKQIESLINNHILEIKEFASFEKKHLYKELEDLDISSTDEKFTHVENEIKTTIDADFANVKPRLLELRIKEREKLRDRNYFKQKNRLKRSARYPESHIYHLSIVAFFFLLECLGNMHFFAEGSTIGYLGGFLQATLVSAVNVGLSYIIGLFGFTQFNRRESAMKWFGGAVIVAYAMTMVVFHFAVAHYRDLLTIDPDNAARNAIEKLRENFFGLETIDSILVLLMGIVIACIACYKGFTHDDPYPGYGRVDREYQKHLKAYNERVNKCRESAADTIQGGAAKVTEELEKCETDLKEYKSKLANLLSREDEYKDLFFNAENVLQAALDKYRECNKKVRTEKDPESFKLYPKIIEPVNFFDDFYNFDEYKNRHADMKSKIKVLRENSTLLLSGFPEKIDEVNREIDGIENEVDNQANKFLAEQNKQQHQDLA